MGLDMYLKAQRKARSAMARVHDVLTGRDTHPLWEASVDGLDPMKLHVACEMSQMLGRVSDLVDQVAEKRKYAWPEDD